MNVNLIKRINTIIEWTQSKLNKNQFIIFSSILVGISVGLAAIVLKTFVHIIFVAATFKELGSLKYLFLLLPVIGIFLTILVV